MKKLLFLILFLLATFSFAQITATPESKDLNQVYKGGNYQLTQNVQNNFTPFNSEYAVNGKFLITFDLDKNGNVINPKVFPSPVDNRFKFDFIRSFKRANNFKSEMSTEGLSVAVNFTPIEIPKNASSSFTREPRTR